MKIGIVLPTYNVETTLSIAVEEVARLMAEIDAELLVVDNHSVDGTVEVLAMLAKEMLPPYLGWTLIQRTRNMGYGASVKSGFEHFLKKDVTHVMVLHSDAQTDNYHLGCLLVDAALKSDVDVVLGSRFLPESNLAGYSLVRRVANGFFNWFTKVISGRALSDAGTAMVLVKTECFSDLEFLDMPDDWRFHPVLNIALGANIGLDIEEIPMRWADSNSGSSVPVIRYGISLFLLLAAIGWRRLVRQHPRWWVSPKTAQGAMRA